MFPRQFAIAVPALLIAGCQNFTLPTLPVIAPYRIDIQQGNVVTQDMVAKLQPGMTRSQVRFVLGTPLVTDLFHSDRWDYVYRFEKAGTLIESRRIVAVFSGDKLMRIEGDVVPAAAKPAVSSAPGMKPAPATDKPAAAAAPAPAAPQPAASAAPATDKPAAAPAPIAATPEPAAPPPAAPAAPAPEAGVTSSPAAASAEPANGENAGRTAGPRVHP